jgi:hypothetical protein
MITSETHYKESDIIRDTWPQIYRPMKKMDREHFPNPEFTKEELKTLVENLEAL